MLKKFLREVVSLVVGKQFEEIADLLDSNKHVNEFLIAKKLDITINQARNLLYKLSDQGLVSSIRKKDKKKGWYTYFWKIEIIKTLEFYNSILSNQISQINNQLKSRETKQFYYCEKCNVEVNEENALLYNFTCNECGNIFSLKDNSKLIKELIKQKDKLNNEIEVVNIELDKELEKDDKKKKRVIKKEEKARKKKMKEKRDERKRLAQKNQSKKPVKKAKKKSKKPKKKLKKKAVKKKGKTKKKAVKKNFKAKKKNLNKNKKVKKPKKSSKKRK